MTQQFQEALKKMRQREAPAQRNFKVSFTMAYDIALLSTIQHLVLNPAEGKLNNWKLD